MSWSTSMFIVGLIILSDDSREEFILHRLPGLKPRSTRLAFFDCIIPPFLAMVESSVFP